MAMQIRKHPQAFSLTAPKVQKRPRQHDEAHLKFIRTLPCVVTGLRDVDAAHIRYGDISYHKPTTGMGEKPHDKWTVPLSPEEHRRQHSMNERDYWTLVGINPLDLAIKLWMYTGDEEACESIILEARPA
jgi:hypothetical protein